MQWIFDGLRHWRSTLLAVPFLALAVLLWLGPGAMQALAVEFEALAALLHSMGNALATACGGIALALALYRQRGTIAAGEAPTLPDNHP